MPAHWWVKLYPVDRAASRGVPRGGCGLRKSLGHLSPDGWSCVPRCGCFVFQHWSLLATGWDQV